MIPEAGVFLLLARVSPSGRSFPGEVGAMGMLLDRDSSLGSTVGIPVKMNAHSGKNPNGIPG
jgi:hypothetical protein